MLESSLRRRDEGSKKQICKGVVADNFVVTIMFWVLFVRPTRASGGTSKKKEKKLDEIAHCMPSLLIICQMQKYAKGFIVELYKWNSVVCMHSIVKHIL